MKPQDWQKFEELLNAALELEPSARKNYVENIDSIGLRGEVESLLALESQADNFLKSPAVALSSDFFEADDSENEDALAGQKIGNYRIVREIGRGGMGAVYLAERADDEYTQKVAVKLLKRELNTADFRRRFRHERHILARLEHPNIARLLDAGTTSDGLPFIVMEFVEGVNIDRYCDEKSLEFNERLRLFRKICDAVAFAHRNLIIHRDLKPSNILVATNGTPKLLDFGIAKLLTPELESDTQDTVTNLGAMTPEFASPEQKRGETVTTATDVYSLGVVLSKLVQIPQPELRNSKTNEQSATTESQRAETVRRQPKTDLQAILQTALREDAARRYSTVENFSDDLRRTLAGLPVTAQPDTFFYRTEKFVQRHKVGVLAALLVILSLLGGVAATIWEARRAEIQRIRAEKRFDEVRKLSTSLLFEISPQIERLPGSTQARETIVKRALEYLDSLAAEANRDDSLQSELATAYEQVGNVQGKPGNPNLGDLNGAIESYRKAQAIRQHLVEMPNAEYESKRLLAKNYYSVGDLRYWSSEIAESLKNYRQAVGIYEPLIDEQPENTEVRLDLIRAEMAIAKVHSSNGEYDDSIPIYHRTIDALENLRGKNPSDTEILRLVTSCHINLGYDLSWKDEMTEAGAEVNKSLAIAEPLFAAYPNDTKVRHSLWYSYYFAGSIFQDANPTLARNYLEKSVNLAKEAADNDRIDFQSKQELAQSYSMLASISDSQKQARNAVELYEKALTILQNLIKDEPRHSGYSFDLANTYLRLGTTQRQNNDLENARQNFENALAIQEKMREKDSADNMQIRAVAFSDENLGQVYELMKQCEKSQIYFQKSYALFSELEQNNVLSDYDRKRIEKQKAAPPCKEQ